MAQIAVVRRSLQAAFASLDGRVGLLPFIPAGYPDLQTTAATLESLQSAGAAAIEIGFPFSDPIADGPIIQAAFTAALARKIRVADVFATVAAVRASLSVPLVGMLSYSIVFRYGLERFVNDAREAGFDGLIFPDLPPPEAERVCRKVQAGGLDTILLVAPSTSVERRKEIASLCRGFLYYLSVAGITGARDQLPSDLFPNLKQLRELTDCPVCVGFGISKPQHLAQLAGFADAAIVGSAFVKQMNTCLQAGPAAIAEACAQYARYLLGEEK